MIRQCFLLKTGILFNKHLFESIGLDPDTIYPEVKPRPPPLTDLQDTLLFKHKPYLNFSPDVQYLLKIDHPFVNEEEEDMLDSVSPLFDQLRLAWGWWILEIIPSKLRYQNAEDQWIHETR